MKARILFSLLLAAGGLHAASAGFQDAVKARIENGYAVVQFANGTRSVVALASLSAEDRALLAALSAESPLAHGKSEVKIVKEAVEAKKTIQVAASEGPLETVQLCQPNVMRDQIGATCMLYARIHWLDIAGYYADAVSIYKISNNSNPDKPWADPFYQRSLQTILADFKPMPVVHYLPPQLDPFTWARDELRKGRPVLAAFPREIWQDLPPGFIAAHPWSGGSVGHQVVINGFTWNTDTKQGTFHIINSWNELPQFDLKTQAAAGAMLIEESMSPKGELVAAEARALVTRITFLRASGKMNLYEVETNLGTRRVAAPSEAAARSMIEDAGPGS
jgi:hypothetical protein